MSRSSLVALVIALAVPCRAATPDAVTIRRDAYGVPHIFTDGPDALVHGSYANGYAQAEDRLFQMSILRRAATGRLAEALGPGYLRMDEVVRRDGFTAAELDRLYRRLPARSRRSLEAYRDGVNAFIADATVNPAKLALEFGGVPPAPWETRDSVAIAVLEFTVFGASGGQEAANAALLLDLLARYPEAEAKGIFDDLFWIDDPTAPTTIAQGRGHLPDVVERFAAKQMDLVRTHADSMRRAAAVLRDEQGLLGGLGRGLGILSGHRHASNAIVVAPSSSASGGALLLGGPQTGLTNPSFFWEVSVHGGGYEAEGVIAPAGPGMIIGRGRNFALTITSGIDDDIDTFVERLDPADPERYVFRGRSRPFERRTETIAVDGQTPVELVVRRSVHGPVFFHDPAAGLAYSRRATFRGKEMSSAAALVETGFVRSLAQFRRLADRVAVSLNLHYADDAGNIGFFHRGILPLRPRHTDPRLPLDGSGTMEWRGTIAARRLPDVVNPRQAFITNWNNKPIAGWSAGEQRELWGVVDRVQPFIDALAAHHAAGTKVSLDDVQALMQHAATSDIFAARIVPFVEDAVRMVPEPALVEAAGRMRTWVDAGAPLVGALDPGATIYTAFRTVAQDALLGDDLGSGLRPMFFPDLNDGDQEDDHGSLFSPDALFLRVLFSKGDVPGATAPPGLPPVSRDYLAPQFRADALAGALRTALSQLTTRFATADQSQWHAAALEERYMEQGLIGGIFGASTIARENRGSFNLLADFGARRHEIIVPPGESGTFTAADVTHEPPHLRDQLPLYAAFQYRRQPFTVDELEPPVTEETIPVMRR
jgi:penicillin G amidase